jgi:hypothetical protein
MDVRLMKDFEELEGLTDQHVDDEMANVDEPDEDDSFRPTIAANLNNADVYDEVKQPLLEFGYRSDQIVLI